MSDELTLEKDESGNPAPSDDVEVKASAEDKAREFGWVPEEEWEGDPDMWVSAKEFLGRAPLFERINKYGKRIETLQKTLTEHSNYQKKTLDAAVSNYENRIAELNKQLKQAAEEADAERVMEVNQEISKTQASLQQAQQEQGATDFSPEYLEWIEQNSWYEDNQEMKEYANLVALGLRQTKQGAELSQAELFNRVSSEVSKRFPDYFGAESKSSAGASRVNTSPGKKSNGTKKISKASLSPEMQTVMSQFAKAGIMTEEEFIEQQIKAGNL